MKIAKKVLAVAMAIAMIACCAAMAFAAEGKVALKATDVVDGKFKVAVVAKNYADLGSADWKVTYDPAVLSCTSAANGTNDFAQIATDVVMQAVMGSKLISAYNIVKEGDKEAGEVLVGFAFEGTLGTAAEATLFTMEFTVLDADAVNVEIKLEGTDEAKLVLFEKEEETTAKVEETTTKKEETTTKKEETTTKAEETTTKVEEKPSTPGEVTTKPGATDGAGSLGDTGALAIAAGVVALAGAAFVVTKKRK